MNRAGSETGGPADGEATTTSIGSPPGPSTRAIPPTLSTAGSLSAQAAVTFRTPVESHWIVNVPEETDSSPPKSTHPMTGDVVDVPVSL